MAEGENRSYRLSSDLLDIHCGAHIEHTKNNQNLKEVIKGGDQRRNKAQMGAQCGFLKGESYFIVFPKAI